VAGNIGCSKVINVAGQAVNVKACSIVHAVVYVFIAASMIICFLR